MSGPWNLGWELFFQSWMCWKIPMLNVRVFFDVVKSWCVFLWLLILAPVEVVPYQGPNIQDDYIHRIFFRVFEQPEKAHPEKSSAYFAGWFTSWNMNDFQWTDSIWKWLCKKDDSIHVFRGDERPTLYFTIVAQAMWMYLSRDWRTRISWKAGYVKGLLRF